MLFGDKLRELRLSKDMTQVQAAKELGVSFRTYQHYESNSFSPRQFQFYRTAADLFEVPLEYLVSDKDMLAVEAYEKGGSRAKRELTALLNQVSGMFAGGELSDEDKEKVMLTVNELYWNSKDINRQRRAPKQHNADGSGADES